MGADGAVLVGEPVAGDRVNLNPLDDQNHEPRALQVRLTSRTIAWFLVIDMSWICVMPLKGPVIQLSNRPLGGRRW